MFTKVSLQKAVSIVLDHVNIQKLIKTTLSKKVLKKLILDTCQKTAFTFNKIIYEQKDGVSMRALLESVLAFIIMTECKKVMVDNLAKEGTIKFYLRYVYDTLLLVKRQDIDKVLQAFNKFDKNLKFTVEKFENETPNFSDLERCPYGLAVSRENTHTGLYISMDSFTLWKWKTTWIRSLVDRAKKIHSKENLPKELHSIKKFASWNGYPKNIVNAIIKRVLSKETLTNDVISNEEKDKIPTVFINISYSGEKGEHLLKKCFKKFGRSTNQKVNFVCRYSVTKMLFYSNMKDKLNIVSKSNVVYQFSFPGCESSYIGKTERTIFKRTKEHVTRADSAIKGYIDICSNVKHLFSMNNLMLNVVNTHEFRSSLVRQNRRIIDQSCNWNVFWIKKAYHIKGKCPILNNGVKASR